MVSVTPSHSDSRSLGSTNPRATDLAYPSRGGREHPRLPTKHDMYIFCTIKYVWNSGTRRAGVTADTLCDVVNARPQQWPSEVRFNPDKPNQQLSGELRTKSVTPVSQG
jgi:hypothetical protein